MASIDVVSLERRARARYEWVRLSQSAFGFSPVVVLVAVLAWFARRPVSVVVLGCLLFGTGVSCLWRRRDLHRSVVPGLMSGLIPLVLALVANQRHGCASGNCSMWCVQACVAGGLLSGSAIAWVMSRSQFGWNVTACAVAISFLTGAMGCSCVGYSGVVGLAAGLAVTAVPLSRVWSR
jgi:hypothetical protein